MYGIENIKDLAQDVQKVTEKLRAAKLDDGVLKIGEIISTLPTGLAVYADVDTKEEREQLKKEVLDIDRDEAKALNPILIDILFDIIDTVSPAPVVPE